MVTVYKHTQFGASTLTIFVAAGILTAAVVSSMLAEDRLFVAFVVIAAYFIIVALFYAFTVEISEEKLKFWFGIGGIRKAYSLEKIRSTKEVVNPWYYLWGIKSIPGGWLYAIGPGTAVEIVFKNSKVIRLGSNQPKELKQAIDKAITGS
jgi:hypothetical protein